VARWLVDIGDSVKKEQVMAIIDTPDLDAQLDAAQAQLNAAEAEAKVKESDAEFAKTTYVRWQTSPKGRSPIRNVKTRRPVTTAAWRSSMPPSPASTSIGRTSTACAI
jgi:membrane fusion protein, multidrug efflux system